MSKINLHTLERFEDSISYLYLERCQIVKHQQSIASISKKGQFNIPCANLNLLLLGPGTTITHAAIKTLAKLDCMVIWSGEHGVRFYAEGLGRTHSSRHISYQAKLVSDPKLRLEVVRNMYKFRFKEEISSDLDIAQLRGKEGQRVRNAYRSTAKRYNVNWTKRQYNPKKWTDADPINRALSVANYCLYGLCHAAIIAAGYSPALGFIHTGLNLSFVYDIADLFKIDFNIPLCFKLVSENSYNVESRVRFAMRDLFYQKKLLKIIIPIIRQVLKVPSLEKKELEEYQELYDKPLSEILSPPKTYNNSDENSYLWNSSSNKTKIPSVSSVNVASNDSGSFFPCPLWDPKKKFVLGGFNYYDLTDDLINDISDLLNLSDTSDTSEDEPKKT